MNQAYRTMCRVVRATSSHSWYTRRAFSRSRSSVPMITPEVVWLSLGILLLLVEVTTGGFWVGFFGLGALVAGLLIWFGVVEALNAQVATFVLASVLPLVLFRRSLVRWLNRDKPIVPIGDAAGQTALLVSQVGPGTLGRVHF